jgi:glycogen operon protein
MRARACQHRRGTYAGVVDKIPYLKAHQLLGYSPVSFFAPMPPTALDRIRSGQSMLRDMVRALHAAGIEVILDVVFNHTAEGDQDGPTICFKGFATRAYYVLERNSPRSRAPHTRNHDRRSL